LIVDDDESFSRQLGKALKKSGFEVGILTTGVGVVDLLKKEPIKVVILDVMLPKMSGFEICREIRKDREIYHIGIMLVSVMGDREEIEHGYAQGCDDFIPKPINFHDFLTRLKSLVSLVENEKLIEPLTTLGSGRYIRLEILRGILLKEDFDLAYIELPGLIPLHREIGNDGVVKLLRMFSFHLRSLAGNLLGRDYCLAHLGGGHFIAKIRSKSLQDFARELKNSWENTVFQSEALASLITDKNYATTVSLLGITTCGFTYYPNKGDSIGRVLERLRDLHSKCKMHSNGILVDRRSH